MGEYRGFYSSKKPSGLGLQVIGFIGGLIVAFIFLVIVTCILGIIADSLVRQL